MDQAFRGQLKQMAIDFGCTKPDPVFGSWGGSSGSDGYHLLLAGIHQVTLQNQVLCLLLLVHLSLMLPLAESWGHTT